MLRLFLGLLLVSIAVKLSEGQEHLMLSTFLFGVALIALGVWIVKEKRDGDKHHEGKKQLGLSGGQWIEVLERTVEESWQSGLFYGFTFGFLFALFVVNIKRIFW